MAPTYCVYSRVGRILAGEERGGEEVAAKVLERGEYAASQGRERQRRFGERGKGD